MKFGQKPKLTQKLKLGKNRNWPRIEIGTKTKMGPKTEIGTKTKIGTKMEIGPKNCSTKLHNIFKNRIGINHI
mgnify:CR=1 FL=1